MITLKVEDYCHDCPDFEADVDKDTTVIRCNDPFSGSDLNAKPISYIKTTISCKYRYRCEAMKYYLEHQKKEEKKDG